MPLPPRLLAALVAVSDRLDRAGVPFLVAGGAARTLLGCDRRPRDLDLEVRGADAARAGRALGVSMRPQAGRGRSGLRGGGSVGGVELDLTADLEVTGGGLVLAPDWDAQWAAAADANAGGRIVRVQPLGEQVARALVLGDATALAKAAEGWRAPLPATAPYMSARLARASAAR